MSSLFRCATKSALRTVTNTPTLRTWRCVNRAFSETKRTKVLIIGAAGRDFHNFNMAYRNDKRYEVCAFTAAQIPGIANRKYPPSLSGPLYPDGIPIYEETNLAKIINELKINEAVFSYSDIHHTDVMHRASEAMAAGASFKLLGPDITMLKSSKPVISVVASRTGTGKSQVSRQIVKKFSEIGKQVVAIRHPMPYGDLAKQETQRYAKMEDLKSHHCTIEEREEYEPYVAMGAIIYAGVDYEKILRQAEKEADIILWDGGNNDMSFIKPDTQICVVDPHRPGHELVYHCGEINARMSDIVLINKVDSAHISDIQKVRKNIKNLNPNARVIEGASPITVDDPTQIEGKKVLCVEDGPTTTHGGMYMGAGMVAAQNCGASEIIDPRPYAVGSIAKTFKLWEKTLTGPILPAMGYSDEQVKELEETINNAQCDVVIAGTPIDLSSVVNVNKPVIRARYELQCIGKPDLFDILKEKISKVQK